MKPPTPPMYGIFAQRSHFESRLTRRSWSCLVPSYLTPVASFSRVAMLVDPGSRAVGIIRDLASRDEFQAALRQPKRVLGRGVELLCGVAEAWHRRAGEELERDLVLRCSEEGTASRVVARELTGASVDLQRRYDRISLKVVLCSFTTFCPRALALAPRTIMVGVVARPEAVERHCVPAESTTHSDSSASA